MTRLTYEQQLDELEMEFATFPDGDRLAIPWGDAVFIAEDADNEIKKLKELLKVAICYIQENDPLTEKIEEALKDE